MLRKCKSFVVYFGFCGSTFSKKIYQFIFFPKLIDKALKTLVFRGYEICAKHLNIFNFLYKNLIHLLDLITFKYESCLLPLTEKSRLTQNITSLMIRELLNLKLDLLYTYIYYFGFHCIGVIDFEICMLHLKFTIKGF